jgi:hypothetical protein
VRFELPDGLSASEEAAVLAALERYFAEDQATSSPWALAGRIDASGMGALQTRRLSGSAWRSAVRGTFARAGVPPLHGRGDAN